MMQANEALAMIQKGLEPTMAALGLKPGKSDGDDVARDGVARDDITRDGIAVYQGEGGTLRVVLENDRAALELEDTQLCLSLLELPQATEKDCRYITEEFIEALQKKYQLKKPGAAAQPKKLPKSISKSAIKNGEAYYDALSFVNSFTGIYPELRAAYKENYETYGEFLAEEFFLHQGGCAAVLQTINANDKVQMKRLFALLNDVYENGVNDVQSLIAVTVLGSLENDEVLLARCSDYMSQDLVKVVIRVNALLAKDKGVRAKLAHPPLYKPKKAKKPGLFQQLMSGGGQGLGN